MSIGPHRITVQGTRCSWPPRQGAGMAATNYEGFKYYKLGGFNHQRWGRMRIKKQWFRWLVSFRIVCFRPYMSWLNDFRSFRQANRNEGVAGGFLPIAGNDIGSPREPFPNWTLMGRWFAHAVLVAESIVFFGVSIVRWMEEILHQLIDGLSHYL